MRYVLVLSVIAGPALAGPVDVVTTVKSLFDRLPDVVERVDFEQMCGHGEHANPAIGYCTSDNRIYVAEGFWDRKSASYELAHVYGHAIQVRHGVADVALREISRRRDEEDALRAKVTQQVDCVAGVVMALAGEPAFDLRALEAEPFTESHWGRNPLNSGPRVSIGTEARALAYDRGYAARDFAVCAFGEMSADLILRALR